MTINEVKYVETCKIINGISEFERTNEFCRFCIHEDSCFNPYNCIGFEIDLDKTSYNTK